MESGGPRKRDSSVLPASAREGRRGGEGKKKRIKKRGNASRGRGGGDSSASTRHYVAAGTNLYKRKTRMPRKVNRGCGRRFAAGRGQIGGVGRIDEDG